jgi:diguanylate cyclase (GGDEF)-like protein
MKILLVEDSVVDRSRIGDFLKQWNLDFSVLGNAEEAWAQIETLETPDLVLLDWMLPGMDGLELCRNIRRLGVNGNYIYTVMLTAKQKKTDLLMAMAAGADDYLAKPVDPAELRAKIMVGKRILELQHSLRFAATHDFLTNLLNRAEIMTNLKRELSRSEREDKSVAIALADIDHFKQINDSLGHAAGDVVLKEVARRLQLDLRSYDHVGRYGGEEFLIVLPGCSSSVAARRADEIRGLVSREAVVTTFAKVPVTISMGVTATSSAQKVGIEELLQHADSALYRAKMNGRNRVEAAPSLVTAAMN